MLKEENAWNTMSPDDMWVYDKLIVAKKLGHKCGPVGIPVPTPGTYIVRPVFSIMGMGRDAQILHIDCDTDHLPVGHFWCEVFHGRHITVDYIRGKQVLCVEGFRSDDSQLHLWDKWVRIKDRIPYPSILSTELKFVNCEFIGNHLIEVHLRHNPDFSNGGDVLIPVWKGQDTTPPEGMRYVDNEEYIRQGFFIK